LLFAALHESAYGHVSRVSPVHTATRNNVTREAMVQSAFAAIVETAIRHDKPVRIGANWGSLDQELLTHLMDENARSNHPINCTRDGGRPFEIGNQVLISSHRKLLWSKAMVVSVAETAGQEPFRWLT
jgi:4-hydroxy-3-methylbut-2-en-1-yl diphosphate synthase IspG/GcpE